MNVETCTLFFAGTARGPEKDRMSTQAYYKERLGFDPADTVAEHQREQRSQHGYEESLSKFKGQNANGFSEDGPARWCNGDVGEHRAGNTQAFWGCWAMFIEAHGRWWGRGRQTVGMRMLDPRDFPQRVGLFLYFCFSFFFSPFSSFSSSHPFLWTTDFSTHTV